MGNKPTTKQLTQTPSQADLQKRANELKKEILIAELRLISTRARLIHLQTEALIARHLSADASVRPTASM